MQNGAVWYQILPRAFSMMVTIINHDSWASHEVQGVILLHGAPFSTSRLPVKESRDGSESLCQSSYFVGDGRSRSSASRPDYTCYLCC